MPVDLDAGLDALKAIGEETRLRMLAVMGHGEVTVTDLTEILGQSQPRVSRHLRVLVDAGLVTKSREGSWAYFRLASGGARTELLAAALDQLDEHDGVLAADRDRLAVVRRRRADAAQDYFERIAPIWDEERSLHAASATVEAAILDTLGAGHGGGTDHVAERATPASLGRVLDVGTGTGRMLQLLADRADLVVGLDASHSMLSVARANLEAGDAATGRAWELRQGDVYCPPFDPQSFDLVVVHQVLHYLEDPQRAVVEAARLLAPGGRLLVVDFAPHRHEFLRGAAHRRLGFPHEQLREWLAAAGLDCSTVVDVVPSSSDGLTVTLWLACDARPRPVESAA